MNYKIKFLVFVVSLIGINSNSNAQTIDNLDKKQGYFNLNLGDTYQKWSSQMQTFIDNGTQKSYIYKFDKPLAIYGYPVGRVITTFSNQKLILLILDLGIWDTPTEGKYSDIGTSLDKLAILVTELKSEFGNPTGNITDEKGGKVIVYWAGEQNFLQVKLSYLGVTKGSRVTIDFGDKAQLAKTLIEGKNDR